MKIKKLLAAVMTLCMVTGAVNYGMPIIAQAITVQQPVVKEGNCYSMNMETGELTLRGEVTEQWLKGLTRSLVTSIVAEKGTVLPEYSQNLFEGYYACTYIDLSNADTSNVKDMSSMFCGCYHVKRIDLSGFDTSKVTSMKTMFKRCTDLTTLDLSEFDTSNVTDMSGMFLECKSLKTLDVSSFNTSNVTDMREMFKECTELTSINLNSFDTSKVTWMHEIFRDCKSLTTIDVSKFDTSNVKSMCDMFSGCGNALSIDVSGFDTSSVIDMWGMFYNCSSLRSLDVSGFDTSKVECMYGMFECCSKLTTLDLSGFNTEKLRYNYGRDSIFNNCSSLNTITFGEKFKYIIKYMKLPNCEGWVNVKDPTTVISGDGEFAEIDNYGKNTYKRLPIEEEIKPTYPTNIKIEYSEKYHQVRFTWDKVEGADRYGIAVYLAGKWRIQAQNITDTVYTSPKNLTPGKTYKFAIAARVNGKWDTANAIKNAVTVTIK
ncbi:BspA family leucine-rich repeat surface protein [Ruminococcus albus]|uniref:Surface protein n=1 Tax=Ruminococcus albus TaxID=1264 RepID=A0A1I1QA36_RUMAL|nr:BspA family leucine-rich repeat surface protein [Ruminococcus albus]SFD18857.1 surface protein [Ruminococcus albus]